MIVAVNDAWRAFSAANGGDSALTGVGVSYLDVCDNAQDVTATEVARCIRSAISGELPAPRILRFPCDAPDRLRIFDLLVSSRFDDDGRPVGASVTLSPVEDHRRVPGHRVRDQAASPVDPDGLAGPSAAGGPDGEQRLERHPVVLISAPAGYGKSTLVAQWVDRGHAGPVAWLQLDPADNDPTRLWADLVAALERIGCPVDGNVAESVGTDSTAVATHLIPRVIEALVGFGASAHHRARRTATSCVPPSATISSAC